MDQLPAFGTDIHKAAFPTIKAYTPLLLKNADYIQSIRKETFAYGSHERQELDIYYPPSPSITNGRKPVLLYVYGGGFTMGAKTLPIADGLCHANIGAFFAEKYGYTVIVADYRLISHGAKFPSGGEDIALAIEWIINTGTGSGAEPIDLYLIGNSAGGVHILTFLLHQTFQATRKKLLSGGETRLRGAIALGASLHFHEHDASMTETLETYFGDHVANCPLGLLAANKNSAPFDWAKAGVRLFLLDSELDPIDEILKSRDDFIREWVSLPDDASRLALAVDTIPGQNHISPFLALGTGIEKEEIWGHQAAAFMETIRKFEP